MATLIPVDDPSDERLADYVQLRDVQLRTRLENSEGIFIAEGEKIIRRALVAGYRPASFLLAPRWLAGLKDLLDAVDAPVYVVTEKLAEQVTGFHVHRGALAAMHRASRYRLEDLLDAQRLIVLEDTVDHSNVGAIIRCAAGLDWDGVLLSPRAADPFYRRAIKTSMGTVFQVPWARMDDWEGDLERLRAAGFTLAAMALTPDSVSLAEAETSLRQTKKLALMMGTEGDGLSAHWLAQADIHVEIPMAHGVDSLNVAAAAAVAAWSLRKA